MISSSLLSPNKTKACKPGKRLRVNGTTYYVLEGINAQTGEEIAINLKTISNLPPQAMSHNWLLLTMDADPKAFNDTSIQAKDNDYVAPDMENQVIIHTGLVGNGETKFITFNAPDETGKYDYVYTFPGHFTAGMRGTLMVELFFDLRLMIVDLRYKMFESRFTSKICTP